ncbi:DNA annealing helicase and endonuclease ZRANB3-like protein [Drosera capensis]
MELDDWDLTAEEFDALERDAIRQLSHRHASPPRSSAAASPYHTPQKQKKPQFDVVSAADGPSFDLSPVKQLADIGRNKIEGSPGPRTLPISVSPEVTDGHPKEFPKVKVKFILHASGNIAVKFPYDQLIVNAVRGVPKAGWNAKERLWIFPMSSLSSAEKALGALTAKVEVENLDPFVQRAISAAASIPDLRDRYDRIPDDLESKLLPFQRDGIRFVLQHGGRALLADEMGLGKTLQAIAMTACVRESWPVLVLTPSSLRLQWASMIQQWLNIPASDIVVVLSQWGGSNKSGFTIVSSTKGSVHLDGLFNIISYDSVVIADESHYLKNAQAKRTNASLPVLRNAQYTILLSGTPALSRPIELFKQLEALCPQVYKNVHEYGNRYCKGSMFGLYQGSSNHEELHNLIKATVMIRRLKKDVLSELPQKRRQQVFLDLAEKDMRQINALFREVNSTIHIVFDFAYLLVWALVGKFSFLFLISL